MHEGLLEGTTLFVQPQIVSIAGVSKLTNVQGLTAMLLMRGTNFPTKVTITAIVFGLNYLFTGYKDSLGQIMPISSYVLLTLFMIFINYLEEKSARERFLQGIEGKHTQTAFMNLLQE